MRTLQYTLCLLTFSLTACASTRAAEIESARDSVPTAHAARDSAPPDRAGAGPVRPGIEVLLDGDMAALRGMRVGLITNHTGKLRDGRTTIDALNDDPRLDLVALFAPEHGIRGAAEGGVTIDAGRDAKTGLPIYSLYGKTRKPTPEMLAGIDVLVFDIQDIGARYYTYPWTMTLAMRAAAENHKRFVVLDRPDPIGGALVQGNVNDTLTFVGLYPVAMRHGMTVGEIARMVNEEYDIGADLVVIPVDNWTRDQYYDETGLPWIKPSPNMPTVEAATHYPGLCLFEGVNVSVGRGTPHAFEGIGAPWLDADALIARLNAYHFPGIRFETTSFTPVKPGDNRYDGERVNAVRFITTDRTTYDPTRVAVAAIIELRKLHPDHFAWIGKGVDRLAGGARFREQIDAGATLDEVTREWPAQRRAFEQRRAPYLLYPSARPAGGAALEQRIRERIGWIDSAEVAVSYIDLRTNRELHINGDVVMHAASTMKVPVLLEIFRKSDAGQLDLDSAIVVRNWFASIADTSHYALDPADDSELDLYEHVGDRMSVRELARRMIVRSSNLATNILIDLVSADSVRATVAKVGGAGVTVMRGVEDIPAYERGLNNTTTSRGLAHVLAAIARCDRFERASCDEMLEILSAQEFNEMIPAGLPPGTRVAHKTGWITKIQHDAAIVFPGGQRVDDARPTGAASATSVSDAPYVLVVLTRGISETAEADALVADISRLVWQSRQ